MKNKIKIVLLTCFLSTLAVLNSCNSESNKTIKKNNKNKFERNDNIYQPPIKGRNVKSVSFTFKAEEGVDHYLNTGSKVSIPKNSIVDANGNPVKGKVKIKCREFHSVKDIFLSGIPMRLNPKSGKYLQSMGMFEVIGFQNGKPVFLKKGSNAFVDIASFSRPGENFKSWYLDSENNWNEIADNKSYSKKELIAEQTRLLDKLKSSGNKIFKLKIDYKRFPELKKWKNAYWELDDFTKTTYKVGNIDIEGLTSIDRLYKPRYVDSIEIEKSHGKKGQFNIRIHCLNRALNSMIKDKSVSYTLDSKPIFDKALIKSKIKYYDSISKNYKIIEKKYNRQIEKLKVVGQNFTSRLEMQYGFGTYNCDILQDNSNTIAGAFKYKDKGFNRLYIGFVSEDKSRGSIDLNKVDDLFFDVPVAEAFKGYKKMFIFSNMPNDQIAFIGYKTYKKQLKVQKGKKKYFEMKKISEDQFWDMLES